MEQAAGGILWMPFLCARRAKFSARFDFLQSPTPLFLGRKGILSPSSILALQEKAIFHSIFMLSL